ncbi:MAG TPA: ATP-binding protein, partial [Bacteroidota bacterium]|nr:ATP-binding protein [Bacteroidota bacterium]
LFYVQRIIGNATHLLGVVEDMLSLTAIDNGKIAVSLKEVDLGELIRETMADFQSDESPGSVVVRSVIPPDALPLETDRQKLKQVLINLIANARKFTQRGTITVSLVVDQFLRPGRIEVQDTGIGIPEEKLKTIFEAFERVEGEAGLAVGGSGLGLTISRDLCRLLGYELSVESEPGRGSVFTINLTGIRSSRTE